MTDRNELVDETRGGWLDTDTLDRMLVGGIHPDDAPPGFAEVAGVLLAVAEAGGGRDLPHGSAHVALAMELVRQRSPFRHSLDRRSRRPSTAARSKMHRGKIGALVVVGAMVGSTGLAAAGALPEAAQDAFAHVLDKVGITVPAGNGHPASPGEDLSGAETPTEAHGLVKGAETSSAASGGKSQAGQHGSADDAAEGHSVPPGHPTNGGGTGTADAASDGASSDGTGTGNEASEGRSQAGSGNASITPLVHARPSEPPKHSAH
jgi:hypothetical protein